MSDSRNKTELDGAPSAFVPASIGDSHTAMHGALGSIAIGIGIMEVTNGALLPAHNSYRYLEAYFAAALIYWVIAVALEQLSALIERRLTRHRKVLA